ncbi:hypothetical protein JHK82_034076 [Glycine max]|nr:hypothetical protein JHK82_034076 [Glycine max]
MSYHDPAYYVLKEDDSPCIFGSIEKQRWSYACAKQLIERLVYDDILLAAEGAENGLEFTIVRSFNWIGPRMDFIPGIDGPSEGVPRVLACFSNNLLRGEPLKLVDGDQSQRTFVYIKDAIEVVLLMIENPARANGHIFNVGNPNNEVIVRQLAEMMTQVYSKVSGEAPLEKPIIDVSSKEFYGEGYDDSDKRIPDMTIINRQLGWNPKTSLWDLLESTLTYQHRTYAEAVKKVVLLGWSFRVLFTCLSSSSFVASTVQEGRNSFREHFPRLEDFAKAIYIFDIGQNDIVAAIDRVGQEDFHAVISDIVDYFENQLQVKTPHQFLGLPHGAWFQDGGFEIAVIDLGLQTSKNSTPVCTAKMNLSAAEVCIAITLNYATGLQRCGKSCKKNRPSLKFMPS